MLQRLDYDQKDKTARQVRKEFDHGLEIGAWRIAYDVESRRDKAGVEKAAPWWWEGDEEASSSFLSSMGVNL